MGNLWDKEYSLDNISQLVSDNSGKEVTLCAVRSPGILETKLGNVFWVLLARRLGNSGCKVRMYDFPDKGHNPPILATQELADIFEVKNLKILKAEEQNQDAARKALTKFAATYSVSPDSYPGLIDSVSEGLLRTKSKLDTSLERMCEELNVFMENKDNPNAVQFSNHEDETVRLMRYLGAPKKRFVRVDLGGIESEFRAERVAKVKDLPTKIILGSGLGKMYNRFNSFVLAEMADALSERAYELFPVKRFEKMQDGWEYDGKRDETIFAKINKLNPHLKTYFAILLEHKGHHFYLENKEFGNELRRATKHVSELVNPDYTWVFNHVKQYNVGFGDMKSFVIELTKRSMPTISSEQLLDYGKHFFNSTNSFYSMMFFEEYIRREGNKKLGEIVAIYNGNRGSNRGRDALYSFITSRDPKADLSHPLLGKLF